MTKENKSIRACEKCSASIEADDPWCYRCGHSSDQIDDMDEQARLAKFGKLCLDYFKRDPDFYGDEISTDIIPLAEQCGLIEMVAFDPEIHNDVSGCCEPGDAFWVWKEINED